jgi:hypothetical protein
MIEIPDTTKAIAMMIPMSIAKLLEEIQAGIIIPPSFNAQNATAMPITITSTPQKTEAPFLPPAHSCSQRSSRCLGMFTIGARSEAPHLLQNSELSGFWLPHLAQYTMISPRL